MQNPYLLLLILIVGAGAQEDAQPPESSLLFTPTVTAVCQPYNNRMLVTVTTLEPFHGIIVSANYRNKSSCYEVGDGGTQTTLVLNMGASITDEDYCGVSINFKTQEKTAQISVRQNRVLELAEDKNYLVSCGKFESPRPSAAHPVSLSLLDSSRKHALEVVKTHAYKLRVRANSPNFRVRNCFAFSNNGTVDGTEQQKVQLFDEKGCPESRIISRWTYTEDEAEATIFSMFRFQDSRTITIQCHVLLCSKESCPSPVECKETSVNFYKTFDDSASSPSALVGSNDTDAIASTTVTVLEPGEKTNPLTLDAGLLSDERCYGRFCPVWLLWLAIALGVLFLLMLLVNLFLCTALTCTCTRTELIEKDPSILEDYDPYTNRSYLGGGGSQYTSRYSIGKPYSDMMSDHYATPSISQQHQQNNSRPNSRFSK